MKYCRRTTLFYRRRCNKLLGEHDDFFPFELYNGNTGTVGQDLKELEWTDKPVNVKDFLSFPSPSKLLQFDHIGDSLLTELGEDRKDVDKVVGTIMKVALVVSKDDEAKFKACECADSLLQNLFNNVDNAGGNVANAFLVNMGLLKSEDKKFSAPKNLTGPLLVLEHVAKRPYFPAFARQILLMFFIKPHPMLEKSSDARHKLLETLHAF